MASSTHSEIVNGHELSAQDWYLDELKVNKSGRKSVSLKHAGTKKRLYVATPLLLTWGANENNFENKGNITYDMSLQFPREQDSNYNENTTNFLENMKAIEAAIKQAAITNSKEWFNKTKMSPDVVDALWNPMLRYRKDQTTNEMDLTSAPTLRVKIPFWDGEFNCEIYDVNQTQLFPSEDASVLPNTLIQKGQNVAVVIEAGDIYFVNGKFGITWRLVQAVIQPKKSLRGRCHIMLDASTKEQLQQEASNAESEDEDDNEQAVEVCDSDDDEVEEEDEDDAPSSVPEDVKQEVAEEVAVVAPKVVKKVVKRGRKKKATTSET
tara:strand:+ start:1772 stop:2740 length:969 start_codon:yes stop_codon:yes gene_type:complete